MDINKISLVCRRVKGLNVGPPDYKPKAGLTSQLHSLVIAVLRSITDFKGNFDCELLTSSNIFHFRRLVVKVSIDTR